MVCFNAAGDKFLYQDRKGFEDEWRKHHTSSITRDVWMYDMASGKHTNLTKRAGEDRNPVLSSDGKEVFFLSERNKGSFNVYSFPLDNRLHSLHIRYVSFLWEATVRCAIPIMEKFIRRNKVESQVR